MPVDALKYSKKSDYPSVTQVLAPYSGYDRIHPARLGNAAERGTIVHLYCASYVRKGWFPMPAPESEYVGYFQSFTQWADMFIDEALLCEEELEDHELKFCGHPDLIFKSIMGGVILVDLKTPSTVHRKVWGAQLAAYDRLAKVNGFPPVDRFGSLRLDKNGSLARFDEFTENRLAFWNAFYAALLAHRFFGDNHK